MVHLLFISIAVTSGVDSFGGVIIPNQYEVVISWLLLRGALSLLSHSIPGWYFLVELFAGIGSGLAYLKGGLLGAVLFLIVYSVLADALCTARAAHSSKPRFLFCRF